ALSTGRCVTRACYALSIGLKNDAPRLAEAARLLSKDTGTTQIYTLSLHDALPISRKHAASTTRAPALTAAAVRTAPLADVSSTRSEEHTSELQSRGHLVCRLLLRKKDISSRRRSLCRSQPPPPPKPAFTPWFLCTT